ncbi:hypothetical protein, conserved [Entamoeba histolytica]
MEEINSDDSSNRRYITRINTEVIPIFRYSASVVNWKITDLEKIDLEIRKYLRKAKYIGETPKIGYRWYNKKGIWNRIKKTPIHKINETKIEEIINEGIEKKKEKEVEVEIKKLLTDQYIKKWKCHQTSGHFRRWNESKGVDKTTTVKAWKSINIKKNSFLQLTKMQDGAIFCGYRKTKIMKNERLKYCTLCKDKIATVEHILISCIYHKNHKWKNMTILALLY